MEIIETLRDLAESLQAWEALPALSWGADIASLSYRDLYELIMDYSRGLLALGAKPGDRVALLCHNRPEWIGLSLGINCAALVDVPRGENSTAEEIAYILDHARPRIVIVENQWLSGGRIRAALRH